MDIDVLNKNKESIIKSLNLPFNVLSEKYITDDNDFVKYMVNKENFIVSANVGITPPSNIDVISEIFRCIVTEISKQLVKIFETKFVDSDYIYIPKSNFQLQSERNDSFINELVFKSYSNNSKNTMLSSLLSAQISSSDKFCAGFSTLSTFQKIGTTKGINIYQNPYLKYDDNRIFVWEDVECYISIDSFFELVSPNTFNPTISLNIEYFLDVKSPILIYNILDENSFGYNLFISDMRDKKIDSILDGR